MAFPHPLHTVGGLLFDPTIYQEAIDLLKYFPVRPDDTWITTYPKSGTTWMQKIVKLILNRGVDDGGNFATFAPRLEFLAQGFDPKLTPEYYDSLQSLPSPRIFKSHYSYNTMPYGSEFPGTRCKCIYVARNPKDVLVSYYYHVLGFTVYSHKPSWDELFEHFLKGEADGGNWFDHVLSFWAHKDDDNILFLKYEDMKKDLPTAVAAISKFLGYELTNEVIHEVAKQTDFQAMKNTPFMDYTWADPGMRDHTATPFMRKGVVGDWKNYFTPEQSTRFDAIYAKRMEGTGLDFEFE